MVEHQQPAHQQKTEQESEYYNEDELWKMMDVDESDGDNKSSRPSYLELANNSGSTPIVSRKPRFQFSGKCHMQMLVSRVNESQ